MDDLAGLDRFGRFPQLSEDRLIGTDFIARHASYENPQPELLEVVLKLHFAVNCNENVKCALGIGQQRRVLAAAPPNFGYRLYRVAAKSFLHPGVDTFV